MRGKYEAPRPARKRSADGIVSAVFSTLLSVLFLLVGISAAAAAVWLGGNYANAQPIMLAPPESAKACLVTMLDAVCEGDYRGASQQILGKPDLGADNDPEDPVGVLLWESLLQSMDYRLEGDCYTTDEGLAQDIVLTCLDLTSITENLRARSQAIMEQRVAEAEDTSEIYDENNEYREDFVVSVLADTVREALAEDARTTTVSLTVNLKYQNDQWWVVADSDLLDAISGSILF